MLRLSGLREGRERDAISLSQSHQIPGKFLNALQMAPLTRSSLPRRVKLRFVNSALPVTLKLSLKDTSQRGSDWSGIPGIHGLVISCLVHSWRQLSLLLSHCESVSHRKPHTPSSWLHFQPLGYFPVWNEFKYMALWSTCNNGGGMLPDQSELNTDTKLITWCGHHHIDTDIIVLQVPSSALCQNEYPTHPSIPQLTSSSPNWQPAVCYCVQQWWIKLITAFPVLAFKHSSLSL